MMKKKLTLSRETVSQLSAPGLVGIAGGTTWEVSRCFSYWVTCGCSQQACANTENSFCECTA